MSGTVRKLFGVSISLVVFAMVSFYVGAIEAGKAAGSAQPADSLARNFSADPGDGWMMLGGFLLLVALALIFAGLMLRTRERSDGF